MEIVESCEGHTERKGHISAKIRQRPSIILSQGIVTVKTPGLDFGYEPEMPSYSSDAESVMFTSSFKPRPAR